MSLASVDKIITKEGIRSVLLKFQKGPAASPAILTQTGSAPNSVNSIYPNLMKLARNFSFAKQKDEYFRLLQQKRSGDWLQVLSSFDTERFKGVPKGMPIYVASEDRLCILYGLCVGANMIYTFRDGNEYYITVFRKDREPPPDRVKIFTEELQAFFGGHKDPETFPIDALGGQTFKDALDKHMEQYNDLLTTLFIPRISDAISAGVEAGTALTRYDTMLKGLLKILINTVAFYFGIPNLKRPDVSALKQFLNAPSYETLDDALIQMKGYRDILAVLIDIYGPTSKSRDTAFIDKFIAIFAAMPESGRHAVVQNFTIIKPFYETEYMPIIEQIAIFLKEFPSIAAPLREVLNSALASLKAQSLTVEREKKRDIAFAKMNLAVFKYLLFKDETSLPKDSLPHLSVLLRTVASPTATTATFSIQRIIAKCFQKSIESKERSQSLQRFLFYFPRGGGSRSKSRPIISVNKGGKHYSHPLVLIWLYVYFLNDIFIGSDPESPRTLAAISIYEFIVTWLNAYEPFLTIIRNNGITSYNESEMYRAYHDGLVSILTTILPNAREMAGIIPPGFGASDTDLEEICGAINMLIFGMREAAEDDYVRDARMLYSLAFQAIQASSGAPIEPTALMDLLLKSLERAEALETPSDSLLRSGSKSKAALRSKKRTATRKLAPKTAAAAASRKKTLLHRSKTRKVLRTGAHMNEMVGVGV